MADFSEFNDQKQPENDYRETDIEGVCSDCYGESKGFYSKKDKTLLLVCEENDNHKTMIPFSYE